MTSSIYARILRQVVAFAIGFALVAIVVLATAAADRTRLGLRGYEPIAYFDEGRAAFAAKADIEARAVLLVAHPDFRDPPWLQTVLLAAPLPDGGHVGVIINRPTTATLGQLFPNHTASQRVADPVYYGGPFSTGTLVAVVKSDASPGKGSFALTKELFLAVDGETIDRVIEQRPGAARYYAGFTLWAPGELKLELAEGLWSVLDADAGTVFRKDMRGLWKELSRGSQGVLVQTPIPQLATEHQVG